MRGQEQRKIECKKCHNIWQIKETKIYWDEKGYGYSTKLCNCPECSTPTVIDYYEDYGLDINIDTRWYS